METLPVFSQAGEFIKAVAPAFTAAAACFGAWIGWRGLEKWRSEALGKRKAEVAEATLAYAYEMEEIMRLARGPWIAPHEMTKKKEIPDEIATDVNYVPEARLLQHQDFFGRYRVQKFVLSAVFGREAAKPFDDLWQCRLEINFAVDDLLRNKEMANGDAEDRALIRQRRAVIFRTTKIEEDVLGKRIAENIAAIESSCRPAIEAREKAD